MHPTRSLNRCLPTILRPSCSLLPIPRFSPPSNGCCLHRRPGRGGPFRRGCFGVHDRTTPSQPCAPRCRTCLAWNQKWRAGTEIGHLLAAVRAHVGSKHLPIVLITDTVTQEFTDRLAEGEVDDLIPRSVEPPFWQIRVDHVLRNRRFARDVETLREGALLNAQMDHLTGVYNRETILSMLFRETDRAQRMNSSLCMILFDIDDFGHWNSRLGAEACDDLLCQIVGRTSRVLRTYDLLGRPGMDEFLVALPGCRPLQRTDVGRTNPPRGLLSAVPQRWRVHPPLPPALASPPARAVPRWSSYAKPSKLSKPQSNQGPNPSNLSATARNPPRLPSPSCLQPQATNSLPGNTESHQKNRLAPRFFSSVKDLECLVRIEVHDRSASSLTCRLANSPTC